MVDLVIDEEVKSLLSPVQRKRLLSLLTRMVKAAAKFDQVSEYEVSVRLTTDAEIRTLNRDFRRKDKATDVLAFAQREGGAGFAGAMLGDIVVSLHTAQKQSKSVRKRDPLWLAADKRSGSGPSSPLLAEVFFLCSHGLCHLLGYDHNNDREETTMNARMASLRDRALAAGAVRAG